MLIRRLAVVALLAGVAMLGRPVAAQRLPSLQGTRAITIVDEWDGFSAIAPIRATYTLRRAADGSFGGTAQVSVGNGLVRRDTSFAVQLSRAAVDSLFAVLSSVPLREGAYRPTFTHTDDEPSITVELAARGSTVRFHTRSQGAAAVPWQVSTGRRTYVSDSEAIAPALGSVTGRMGRTAKQALMAAAERDPEAQCNHARYAQSWLAQRPRYAAGEAWFNADSTIAVEGRNYRRHGIPRYVGLQEITPHAEYRGVPLYKERGMEGTPEYLYVPYRASCEVQVYALHPRP